MKLIDQHTKKIIEGCKVRAREAGLSFQDESLEYIVTNKDLVKLSPKIMIPTLYDYWVHDLEVIKGEKIYEVYPNNPYETVINTRPPISFYNDNNPDWLNIMIFYHVLGHIDFFQNNSFFSNTWDYDFTAEALADKRHINILRSKYGRQVDYIIEFARSIDNLVGYHRELSNRYDKGKEQFSDKINYFFDIFLQQHLKVRTLEYLKNIDHYNDCVKKNKEFGEINFLSEIEQKYPEFPALFTKYINKKQRKFAYKDILQYLIEHSPFINKENNRWMKTILEIIRSTSLFFQPQIRTKIMNEGWASYWHENLFLSDDRIKGHEVQFAITNAKVTSLPRVGLNPYAIGLRLFRYIEQQANKGKFSFEYEIMKNNHARKQFNQKQNTGRDTIFEIRKEFCDSSFLNTFIDQEFVSGNHLFVTGKRLNQQRMTWEYFIKSKNYKDYAKMLSDYLYHPPTINIADSDFTEDILYLNHDFEGKPLIMDFIQNTLFGISYLWGGPVKLETSEVVSVPEIQEGEDDIDESEIEWKRVVYTMENKQLRKKDL